MSVHNRNDAAIDTFRGALLAVLEWREVYGRRSLWEVIKRDVAKLNPVVLVGCASHWNALIHRLDGSFNPDRHAQIVRALASAEQLESIDSAVQRRVKLQGWARPFPPPILNRQQLLILMRLAFQHGDWTGGGAEVGRNDLLDILLRINDHLDALPPPIGKRRPQRSSYERLRAFPLMFSLSDFSRRRPAENGVARTLRMMREVQGELAAREDLKGQYLDVRDLFEQGSGLALETFLSLSFAAVSLTTPPGDPGSLHPPGAAGPEDTGTFNIAPQNLIGDSTLTEAEVERFVANAALTPEQFREQFAAADQAPEQNNFTLFRKHPLVTFPGGAIRVLDREFLLGKLGDGAYWVLRGVVERDVREGQERIDAVKRLNGWWGALFEQYVHALVENSPVAVRYTRNPTFEDRRGRGATDGLLDYRPEVVLFEYKMSLITPRGRHTVNPRVLAAEILQKFAGRRKRGGKRSGARGVPQLAAAVRGLLGGTRLGPIKPDEVQAVYPVLVCGEPAMAAPMVNCLLQRQLARELTDIDQARVRPLTVLTIDDFERLLSRADGRSVPEMLRIWFEHDPQMLTYPALVLGERVFRDDGRSNAWVRAAAEAWKEEMLRRLWPRGGKKSAGP